jgi:hypothetical protein
MSRRKWRGVNEVGAVCGAIYGSIRREVRVAGQQPLVMLFG